MPPNEYTLADEVLQTEKTRWVSVDVVESAVIIKHLKEGSHILQSIDELLYARVLHSWIRGADTYEEIPFSMKQSPFA